MIPDVEIYDTTLRDGTQGHGVAFSVADKLRIAEQAGADVKWCGYSQG